LKKLALVFFVFIIGCNPIRNTDSDIVLARVYDKYLYLEDMEGLVPPNASMRDSLTIVQNYINKWIKQQLIIGKSEQNLTREERDFSVQLEEYHNSLIIYAYESKLIRQNLDTSVSLNEIEDFYIHNKSNFELKENIIKYNYVKLHVDSPDVRQFRKLVKTENFEELIELEELCKAYASDYWLVDEWVYFNDILNLVPVEILNQERFLTQKRNVELQEDPYWYFVNIKDYILKDSISPLHFEEGNIKNIIINNRKLELVKNMRKDLMEIAISNNDVEVF